MKRIFLSLLSIFLLFSNVYADSSTESMQKQIDELKEDMKRMSDLYEAKIAELEARLAQQERKTVVKKVPPKSAQDLPHGILGECHHGLLGDKVKVIGGIDARFHNVEKQKNSLFLHEAKIGVQADITDWLFGYITLTKHDGEEVEIEEAYAILKYEELGISAKPGKFFVKFGPENQAHFFDRRTITLSAMHEGLFDHEPWADTGLQIDWKLPLDFYSNLSFAVVNGDNGASFGDGEDTISNNNFPIVLDWTNVFNTDYGIFRFGPSFSWGQWDENDKYNVYLVGGNAYYKLGNFDAQAEFIYRYKEQMPGIGEENAYGYYAWLAYTIPLEYKYFKGIEFLGGFGQFIPDMGDRETRITPQISLIFTDFAKLRITYEIRNQYPKDRKDNRFITQFALAF